MGLIDKQTDLIDDAYKNYSKEHFKEWEVGMEYESKESFINKIKTDDGFAKKWGLKIETRELSLEERFLYGVDILGYMGMLDFGDHQINDLLDFMGKYSVPTKLTTITYNGQTQEIYE